jgi:hypothetical protein
VECRHLTCDRQFPSSAEAEQFRKPYELATLRPLDEVFEDNYAPIRRKTKKKAGPET